MKGLFVYCRHKSLWQEPGNVQRKAERRETKTVINELPNKKMSAKNICVRRGQRWIWLSSPSRWKKRKREKAIKTLTRTAALYHLQSRQNCTSFYQGRIGEAVLYQLQSRLNYTFSNSGEATLNQLQSEKKRIVPHLIKALQRQYFFQAEAESDIGNALCNAIVMGFPRRIKTIYRVRPNFLLPTSKYL